MVNINTPVRELYFEINSKQFKTIGELKNFIKDYIPADFNVEFYGRSEFKIYYKDPYYKGFHFYINRYSNYYEVYAEPNFGVYYK